MSKYTTELRFICEEYAGLEESKGYSHVDSVISSALPKLFDFDFPIFDESYRNVLETKIVKHYYTREICCETVGRWKLFLNTKLNEIMPYYNKLYESANLAYNPLWDVDYTREGTKDGSENGTNTNNGTSTTNSTEDISSTRNYDGDTWNTFQDTPQGSLQNVRNETYLSEARHTDEENEITDESERGFEGTTNISNTENRTNTTTDEYLEHIYGKTGGASYSKLIKEYRDTFINIDLMIIEDLSDLFFGLW